MRPPKKTRPPFEAQSHNKYVDAVTRQTRQAVLRQDTFDVRSKLQQMKLPHKGSADEVRARLIFALVAAEVASHSGNASQQANSGGAGSAALSAAPGAKRKR